jgi:hypothetical protein
MFVILPIIGRVLFDKCVWRDDLDASGPTINLRRDRSVWIMFLLIASCNS